MAAGDEGSPVFDFTSLDYAGVERDLIRYAQARFTEEVWSDLNPSNEGRRLIELMAYGADLVSYTENAHVLETVISSLIREQNFRKIAEGFDFTLASAVPSETVLRFTLDAGELPLVIPSTYKVANSTGEVIFQPNVAGIATTTTYDVAATQGDEVVSEALGTSDATSSQRYALARSPLLDGTLTITVGGTSYGKITNFIEASATEEVYRLETDENGISYINFGDGINGKVPPLGAAIVAASYKVGGGSDTNFPVGSINRQVSSLTGVLSVTNITSAENGGPKPSLRTAKRLLPLSIKANERAVTTQDYATVAESLVPGVLKARGVSGLFQAGGNPVILFIVPTGGGALSDALANQIVTTLRFGTSATDPGRAMAGKRVYARTAVYVDLLITADTYVQKGSTASLVGARVTTAFANRYALSRVEFGEAVDTQDAYNTVDPIEQGIDGLSRVFLRKFSIRPYYGTYITAPPTGNGSAQGIDTLNPFRREWNILVGVSNTFTVRQRRLGTISALGDSSLEDQGGSYVASELVTATSGYVLHVREQEQAETFTIAANTQSLITISGVSSPSSVNGLLTIATPGDTYVVEKTEAATGTIARATLDAAAAAGLLVVSVDSETGFSPGDEALVRDLSGNSEILTVDVVGSGSITFTTALTFDMPVGGTVDWFWRSDDGTAGFALVNGSTAFVSGDQAYVDVYPDVGDIQLRPENFPLLATDDLIINPIGGVR